jgi:hypothetical protein
MNTGIFGLNQPEELLDKLEHDFERLQDDMGQQVMLYKPGQKIIYISAD